MMRRLLLPAAAFLLALLVGAWAADALRSEDLPLEAPPLAGELVPLLPSEPVESEEDLEAITDPATPWAPVEVAAEYHPIDREAVPGTGGDTPGSSGPGSGDPGFGTTTVPDSGEPAEPGDPVTEDAEPPADPGFDFPIDLEAADDLLFDLTPVPWFRFLDFCADHGDDGVCPFGVGAIVLADYDGPGEPGPFSIAETLYPRPSGWWRCPDPGTLRTGEYLLMIMAKHPSRMEISYHPAGDPTDVTDLVVDTTAPSHPELGHWLDLMLTTGGPVSGQGLVHHCFVLDGGRAARAVVIEATATSITGETDSEVFTFYTSENRRRPPVTVAPLSDHKVTVAMPVQGDYEHSTVLRLIESTEELSCTDIERDAVFGRSRSEVVSYPESGYRIWSGYDAAEEMGDEIISAPDWPYDPSYDTYQFWSLNLREGRGYLLCMWWVESAARSFDEAIVVDRESRWVVTPDRTVTKIRVHSVRAPSGSGVVADSIRVRSMCASRQVPAVDVPRDGIYRVPAGEGYLCDYQGYEQPPLTGVDFVSGDGTVHSVLIATPEDAEPGMIRTVTVDLDVERASGLCGSSFGPCDPPTTVYPGPRVTLLVETYEGGTSGWDDWMVRGPETFGAAPTEPQPLPEMPRLDLRGSEVSSDARDRVRVVVGFDRPVSLSARIYGADDDPCLAGEMREIAIDELRQVHDFSFDGLCTLREYSVNVTATDADGHTITYAANSREEGAPWYGSVFTKGWPVRYIVGLRSGLGGTFQTSMLDVGITGSFPGRIDLEADSRCLVTITSREQVAEWRETVTVAVDILFREGGREDGSCFATRGGLEWSGSATAEVTTDDLRAGRITIMVPVTRSDGRGSVSIAIDITGRVGGY